MSFQIFKINECQWYISPWDIDKTMAWYNQQSNNTITKEEIIECNIYTEGMWLETSDEIDIETLGESEEIISYTHTSTGFKRTIQFGDLTKINDVVYKYCSLKIAIEELYESEICEPELFASNF